MVLSSCLIPCYDPSCRSPSLPPLVHIAIPYFLYDCYAMYATSAAEARAKDYSVRRWTNGFAKKQLPFFVHHILICILGYPIAVVSAWVSCECFMCAVCVYSRFRVSCSQAHCKRAHDTGMFVLHALEFIHMRLCRSTDYFINHVSDCSVQCASKKETLKQR